MKLLNELWNDESGAVVSAELVLLGTLGVVGIGVGAAAVGNSVESELEEVALSIRSLDQSYRVQGFQGCGAWTAGSAYTQRPVERSRAELRRMFRRERAARDERAGDGERRPDDRNPQMRDDERHGEPRRRMREREMEQRQRDSEEGWDGDDFRQRREREEPDES